MMNLIKSAFFKACKYRLLRIAMGMRLQRLDLFLIMQIDKRLYGFNGRKNRLPPPHGWKETGQKACDSPQWQHEARAIAALQLLEEAKMFAFSGQMLAGESQQFALWPTRENATVNPDGARFAGMAAAHFLFELRAYSRN